MTGTSNSIKVAVRLRPPPPPSLPSHQNESHSLPSLIPSTIHMNGDQVTINTTSLHRTFTFDHCFDIHSTQQHIFDQIGSSLLQHSVQGYNTCIFAYGQTGSGKTHTMMGSQLDPGLIPRMIQGLFETITIQSSPRVEFEINVSLMEIYNEKVRDLLNPDSSHLRVREHPIEGVHVENLLVQRMDSAHNMITLIQQGFQHRTVASTRMNEASSRSHCILTIYIRQVVLDHETGIQCEKMSRMCLVDLAGSERVLHAETSGQGLIQGCFINRSLTTLGLVISKLSRPSTKPVHIPYRDSVLTWILKDNLGGNAMTTLLATLSASPESMSTLRFAERAKRIINTPRINQDENAQLIQDLKSQIESLKKRLKEYEMDRQESKEMTALRQQFIKSEELIKEMIQDYKQKWNTWTTAKSSGSSTSECIYQDALHLNDLMEKIHLRDAWIKHHDSTSDVSIVDEECFSDGLSDLETIQEDHDVTSLHSLLNSIKKREQSMDILSKTTLAGPSRTRIMSKCVQKWKQAHKMKLVVDWARSCRLFKQANCVSLENETGLFFKPMVIQGDKWIESVWDKQVDSSIATTCQFISNPSSQCTAKRQPRLAVHVVDVCHDSMRIWDMDQLDQFIKTPLIQDTSSFTLIGKGHLSVSLLHNRPSSIKVSLYNLFTCDLLCHLTCQATRLHQDNQTLSIQDVVLSGLNEDTYTDVHVQFYASTLDGYHVMSTRPVFGFGVKPIHYIFQGCMELPSNVTRIHVNVYGKCCFSLEPELPFSFSKRPSLAPQKPCISSSSSESPIKPLQTSMQYTLMSTLQILQLCPDSGEFNPVPCTQNEPCSTFHLRPGLQRRLLMTLYHPQGPMPWSRVDEVSIGNIRLDPSPCEDALFLPLHNIQQSVFTDELNGHGIRMECVWDSSLHNSCYLNKASHQDIYMTFEWSMSDKEEKKKQGACFSTTVCVTMGPSSGSTRYWPLFVSPQSSHHATLLYHVTECQQRDKDIHEYIRGEELLYNYHYPTLQEWIQCYTRLQHMSHCMQVDVSRQVVTQWNGSTTTTTQSVLLPIVRYWSLSSTCSVSSYRDIQIQWDLCTTNSHVSRWSISPFIKRTASKKGWLNVLHGPDQEWKRYWITLVRPCILLYSSQHETDLISVISLINASLAFSSDIPTFIQKPHTFAIYTRHITLFQAANAIEWQHWREHLDPLGCSIQYSQQSTSS